jgi:hypothetical protein
MTSFFSPSQLPDRSRFGASRAIRGKPLKLLVSWPTVVPPHLFSYSISYLMPAVMQNCVHVTRRSFREAAPDSLGQVNPILTYPQRCHPSKPQASLQEPATYRPPSDSACAKASRSTGAYCCLSRVSMECCFANISTRLATTSVHHKLFPGRTWLASSGSNGDHPGTQPQADGFAANQSVSSGLPRTGE